MAMRKRADGIVPLCDLAAREKTSVSGVGWSRNCSRDGWRGPTSSRDSPAYGLNQSTHQPSFIEDLSHAIKSQIRPSRTGYEHRTVLDGTCRRRVRFP